mmetsp:Transcript_14784/g.51508  ORF Transcript_14784/g.51508 Transcript_14784/m.51508 type:complete len:265 (-) Transcript_14784:626-1420(-)
MQSPADLKRTGGHCVPYSQVLERAEAGARATVGVRRTRAGRRCAAASRRAARARGPSTRTPAHAATPSERRARLHPAATARPANCTHNARGRWEAAPLDEPYRTAGHASTAARVSPASTGSSRGAERTDSAAALLTATTRPPTAPHTPRDSPPRAQPPQSRAHYPLLDAAAALASQAPRHAHTRNPHTNSTNAALRAPDRLSQARTAQHCAARPRSEERGANATQCSARRERRSGHRQCEAEQSARATKWPRPARPRREAVSLA